MATGLLGVCRERPEAHFAKRPKNCGTLEILAALRSFSSERVEVGLRPRKSCALWQSTEMQASMEQEPTDFKLVWREQTNEIGPPIT